MKRTVWAAMAVAGCAVMVLSACGSQRAEPPTAAAATATATANATAVSPAKRAAADAASMLAAFSPPPGATRTGPLTVALLAQVSEPMSPDLVTRTRWYRAPGRPLAVLGWITAHCPSGMTLSGSGGVGWIPARCGTARQLPPRPVAPGMPQSGPHFPAVWDDVFSNAAGELVVSVADDGPDTVAVRVDAQVIWLPAKPAAERVPATAKVVTIVHVPGSEPQPAGDAPVTITDPGTVARIAAVIDGLPVSPPGIRFCPLDDGSGMRLTFRAARSGPALAVVTAQSGGCGTVAVTIGGKPMPALAGAASMQQQVAKIAGLHWPAGQLPSDSATTPAAPTAQDSDFFEKNTHLSAGTSRRRDSIAIQHVRLCWS